MRSMARVGAYFLFSSVILTTLWHSGDTAMGGSLFDIGFMVEAECRTHSEPPLLHQYLHFEKSGIPAGSMSSYE